MKTKEQCPLCSQTLETRDVAPCVLCGFDPKELEECRSGQHTYTEYELFPGIRVILCNFCLVDLSSYDPTFFGLPKNSRIGLGRMNVIRDVAAFTGKDKYCPECNLRLKFLEVVVKARGMNGVNNIADGRC